ncbi:class II aldolase/adducin family protein [Oryzicola mucosus]|uniref:Class II aldolase n=1 Tax=Oryzicola mucosus TaxID=2767425 RepID=A0A8J6PVL9_9HYPH|nr:class II aldolase/adducin family protein [Oryzicola mucosus]MBD0415097.1 class II aldolase [Oryzicola mucosus]
MSAPITSRPSGFGEFLGLSREIGRDILKTQGAGGNTSLKQDSTMWVKASGTWLSQAEDKDIMVPVSVAPLVDALRAGDPRAEKATDFVVDALNGSGLRPSIETSFHAVLPSAVVAHYHCVNTIAHAVLENRDVIIAERLAEVPDLTWKIVPYRRPGVPLALEIEQVAADAPDILILHNHGIIVCGETVEQVAERVARVTTALEITPRKAAAPDLAVLSALAEGTDFQPAADLASHAPALDPVSLRFALGGSLYPDHVIFLGTKIGLLEDGQALADLTASFQRSGEPMPKMVFVPGKGVLLSTALTPGGEAMARCLAEVVARIPEGETVAYLDAAQEHELTHWEAEQYRQALDRKVAGR